MVTLKPRRKSFASISSQRITWFSWGIMLTGDQLLWKTLTFCSDKNLSTSIPSTFLWEITKVTLYSPSTLPIFGKDWMPTFVGGIVMFLPGCHLPFPRQMG